MRASRETIKPSEGHSFRLLRWDKSLREVERVTAPGQGVALTGEGDHWHYHTEMELTLFNQGEGTRFVGDHIGPFQPGDLVLLGEKLPHYWHCRNASSGISVQWHFPESHPFWAFPETLTLGDLFQRASKGLRISGRTAQEVKSMLHALPLSRGAGRLALLLGMLNRIAESAPEEIQPLSARAFALESTGGYRKAITEAVRHLSAHFREEIRLEDLLQLTGMSRSVFARQFKQHSGRSFSGFLNGLRLEAACRELREGSLSILDTALACGFTQVSFFNRIFRRVHGCSPSEYRQQSKDFPV